MDISASMGVVEDPSDPEELAISDSDSSINRSSVETDPDNGLEITCDLLEKFNQGIGPWLFEVLTCAFRHGEEQVASVHGYLIKKEEIKVRDNKKKSFRKAMKDEDHMLNVMFELPRIFHPRGPVNPEFLDFLGQCFTANDMRAFSNTKDAAEHPSNRAWILLIRNVEVEAEYRQLGIGSNMIRKTIQRVMEQCIVAHRPLLVVVQPKRIDEFSDEEWAEISELVYNNRVNDVFWECMGFCRLGSSYSGFTAPWWFWGSACSLPPKKRITIPDNLENRNTRTATPPPRAHSPRDYSQSNPYKWFPVVEGRRVRSLIGPQAPQEDNSAPEKDAADNVRWFDNPDDPSINREDAQLTRNLMRTLDALGKEYRVRPLKEPVQAPVITSPSRQSNCPFKAPAGAKAPQMLNLFRPLYPKPPAPSYITPRHAAAVPEQSTTAVAGQSVPNQVSLPQPGSCFLLTT